MCRIRDKIDKMMQKDRALSLLIAMESALEDERFEVCLPARGRKSITCLSDLACPPDYYFTTGAGVLSCSAQSRLQQHICQAAASKCNHNPIMGICHLQEAVRLRDAFKTMTVSRQGAFTAEGVIDV